MKNWCAAGILLMLLAGCNRKSAGPREDFKLHELAAPAKPGSQLPNLFAAADGRIYLSWVEKTGDEEHTLFYSRYDAGQWSPPQAIAAGQNWFVNWADFPSLIKLPDQTLAAHWLAKSGENKYAYDVNITLSTDAGKDWRHAIVPHRDGTPTEHGFVSLLPWPNDRLGAIWLDGRNFANTTNGHAEEPNEQVEMTLRFAALDPSGQLHEETILDARVCECCQTDAAATTNGAVVVYRDRSPNEIRDIGIVRYQNGNWTAPRLVHADHWEHNGCPVNGPAVATNGAFVAVAWYTAAQDTPCVRVAFSHDEGVTFGPPLEVGDREPMGRVDLILLPDSTALVSWLEQADSNGEIRLRRVRPDGWRGKSFTLAQSSPKRASGFPRMARNAREIVFAWTQADSNLTSVRTAAAKLEHD
jgi:hypothetical protein